MRISDWSSDVCSSDLVARAGNQVAECEALFDDLFVDAEGFGDRANLDASLRHCAVGFHFFDGIHCRTDRVGSGRDDEQAFEGRVFRSEEHTSELQSLMRISYAVFCLKKKNNTNI